MPTIYRDDHSRAELSAISRQLCELQELPDRNAPSMAARRRALEAHRNEIFQAQADVANDRPIQRKAIRRGFEGDGWG